MILFILVWHDALELRGLQLTILRCRQCRRRLPEPQGGVANGSRAPQACRHTAYFHLASRIPAAQCEKRPLNRRILVVPLIDPAALAETRLLLQGLRRQWPGQDHVARDDGVLAPVELVGGKDALPWAHLAGEALLRRSTR